MDDLDEGMRLTQESADAEAQAEEQSAFGKYWDKSTAGLVRGASEVGDWFSENMKPTDFAPGAGTADASKRAGQALERGDYLGAGLNILEGGISAAVDGGAALLGPVGLGIKGLGKVAGRKADKLIEAYVGNKTVPRLEDGSTPKTLYRHMSKAEYDEGMKAGVFKNKGGYTHASASPDTRYADKDSVLVKIDYDDADGWSAKYGDGGSTVYAGTFKDIPANKISKINAEPQGLLSKSESDWSNKFTEEGYHYADSREPFDTHDLTRSHSGIDALGVHVGTPDAAYDRYRQLKGLGRNEDPASIYRNEYAGQTRKYRLNVDKPVLDADGEVLTESGLRKFYVEQVKEIVKEMKDQGKHIDPKDDELLAVLVRQKLAKEGYTNIPYINDVEDMGSVSNIMLVDRPKGSDAVLRSVTAKMDPANRTSQNVMYAAGGEVKGYAAGGEALLAKQARRATKGKPTPPERPEVKGGDHIVPAYIRSFLSDVFTDTDDETRGADYFSEEELMALEEIVKNASARTGANAGSIDYSKDYPDGLRGVFMASSRDVLSSDPIQSIKKTLGDFAWEVDEDGGIHITDQYNFNDAERTQGSSGLLSRVGQFASETGKGLLSGNLGMYGAARKAGAYFGSPEGKGAKFDIRLNKT